VSGQGEFRRESQAENKKTNKWNKTVRFCFQVLGHQFLNSLDIHNPRDKIQKGKEENKNRRLPDAQHVDINNRTPVRTAYEFSIV
jgi:hypothetical protein